MATAVPEITVQTENRSYARNTRSRALLNIDRPALERNRANRARQKAQNQEVRELRATVSSLERRINELAQLVEHAAKVITKQE